MESIKKCDVGGKKVIVRVDFNVPIEDGKIVDDTRIISSLKTINYLLENGTVSYLHEHEIYSCLMQFNTDDGTAISKEILELDGDNTDPLKMNEADLFAYIKGELIQNRKISDLLNGFGATQVEQY